MKNEFPNVKVNVVEDFDYETDKEIFKVLYTYKYSVIDNILQAICWQESYPIFYTKDAAIKHAERLYEISIEEEQRKREIEKKKKKYKFKPKIVWTKP